LRHMLAKLLGLCFLRQLEASEFPSLSGHPTATMSSKKIGLHVRARRQSSARVREPDWQPNRRERIVPPRPFIATRVRAPLQRPAAARGGDDAERLGAPPTGRGARHRNRARARKKRIQTSEQTKL